MRSDPLAGGERPISRAAEGRRIGERELIGMMALLMACNAFGIDAILPALDDLAGSLGAQGNDRQFVVGIYLLAGGIGTLIPGAFADRYGRRPVLFTALGFYIAFSLACALVTSFTQLIVLRALQGFFAAGIIALPPAIIRDRVGGDKMARMMSLIFVIFLLVPAVAPSIGQGVLLVMGDWRWIFVSMAVLGVAMTLWVHFRLPETLHEEDKQPIRVGVIARNMRSAVTLRSTIGYTLASALVFGGLFGFINSSQQLIGEAFGAGDMFPLLFAICAGCMALANWSNSRIVERHGARRVSHTALFLFIIVAALQLWFANQPDESLWTFVPLMAANMSLLGFIGANFGSIAMQPFRHIAGAASSAQSFMRMTTGALLGAAVGYAYDGTARPLALALLVTATVSLAFVLYSERGRLFGPPEPDIETD
ncbi:multidrug effflux MFS transporter [Qipengyuania flava]|uniref:multidrug effflux MFS transporter n=1 Tax=Qipengyuania flava TaxID=192812 RepID=UPI0007C21069|nr:multidrug effflux MFS transporter [Qipengyuania flava]KZX52956.1 Bcr/CflA subfamily drug resistance transporter [Erythrobacter sp. HI00D59]MBO9503653.1 multidrug effflux MFS transporter [Qipengyuania flava]MEC8838142.1 multidrug effflux MFS transporter [Pseudomonadota bacterium]|tara:strand:+ start:105 stop:1376 length:1272 start_codon:yes stop_codon:yes gene_type:complete